jgi:hypothetical protein
MATRISEKHDTMILQLVSGRGLSAANKDTLLQNVKTQLDATVAMFKNTSTNDYTVPHVRQALSIVLARGK